MRPMDFDVLQDLVDSGDLDPSILSQVPTYTLQGTVAEWTRERNGEVNHFEPVLGPSQSQPVDCPNDYLCQLDPSDPRCD